jgi:protoporphyrinogen oxidase
VSTPVSSNRRHDVFVDVVVLGAGATGLGTAAFFHDAQRRGAISAHRRLVVVEAEDEPGGYCRTVRQDGFVFDYAGHFFHFRDPSIADFVMAKIPPGRLRHVERRAAVIDVEGYEVPYPYQGHLRALPRELARRCLVDLWHAEQTPPSAPASSFTSWAHQRLGRGLCDRFVIPYNEKLYATELDRLDAGCMGRFFPQVRFDDVVGAVDVAARGYNATFTWPDDGAMTYIEALRRDLDPADLWLGERVTAVDLERRLVTTTKRVIACGAIVSSVPLPRLLALATPTLDVERSAFSWNRVLVFNLGFDRKGRRDVHWLYVARRDVPFYRVGFYDVIADTDRLSLYVEIGLPSTGAIDVAALKAATLAGLETLGITTGHRLISAHHVVMDPAYVHLTPLGMRATEAALAQLARAGVWSAGRYGAWTYCSIEDNLRQARALVEGPLREA